MISVTTPALGGTSRTRLASRLLAGTALVLLLSAGQALANGGRGGDRSSAQPGSGGAGGIDNPTGAGGAGARGQIAPGGNAGGGGGGAGAITGGTGGLAGDGNPSEGRGGDGGVHGAVGAALPAGANTGSNGGDGTSGYFYSGGGGGAGGFGAVVTGAGATGAIAGTLTGGNGGHGGGSFYGFGGGGGSGGTGLLFTDGSAAQTLFIDGTIQGGKGGNGGSYVSDGTGAAGAAGVGGAGLVFTNGGATTTLTVNGTVRGGDGGRGGSNLPTSFGRTPNPGEEANGVGAAGGEAIVGADLIITNNGTIEGGLSGDGTTRAAALHFTGGSNKLTIGSASATINGGIVIDTGTLTFDQTIAATISSVVSGGGSVAKEGSGTLTLTGENTYTGGTTLSAGKLSVSQDTNLGDVSGGLTFNGGALQVTASFSTARAVTLNANGTVEVTADQTFTMDGAITGTGGIAKTGTGTLVLTGTNFYTGGTTISAGTLSISSDANLGNAGTGITLSNTTIVGGAGTGADAVLRTMSTFSSGRSIAFTTGGGRIETDAGTTLTLTGSITTSGSASFIKQGAGTLVLTGNSSGGYNGRTWVNEGTLRIEGGGKLGNVGTSGQAYISNGATAIVTGTGSSWETFGQMRVGEIGSGTLLIENGGSVRTGSGSGTVGIVGVDGDSSVTITGAGSQWVGSGTHLYVGHANAGTLTLSEGGTLQLTVGGIESGGSNTTLDLGLVGGSAGGTVNIGAAEGSTATAAGNLIVSTVALNTSASKLVFNHTEASYSFSPSITGTGSVRQLAGTTILKSASSYSGATTVSGGTLRAGVAGAFSQNSAFTVASGATLDLASLNQTIASLAGAGMVTLGSGTLTAGSDNSSTTFSGTITGTGGVTKTGTGTLTLTGTNTYTGSTKVSSGKLVVNGSLASTVVLDGGTLGGSGTIAGVSVGNGATVAPGNSIGTLTVSGNVSFASGSTYQVEVNAAGQGDRIVASGSATISGGTVQVLAENGNYAASTNYTILTASGGVNGTFTSVTSNLAFLTPSLSYGGTNVTLTMTRNDTSFGPDNSGGSSGGTSVAATRNQGFIAMAAERLGGGNPVYDVLISATADQARAGFDLLSGEAHAQAVSVMIDESRLVRDTILSHLRGPLLTQAPGQVAASFTADLPGRKSGIVMPAPVPQPRYALWGTAFGSTGNTDGDGNAASMSRRSGGALLGADVMLYDAPGSSLKVGVAGGYSQSRFDLDARRSSGKLESGHAALYAGARFGQLRLDAGAAYTWSESDIRRQIAVRGFGDLLRLQRPGSVTQGFAELGYAFAFSGVALEPFAQLALIRVSTDAGTERGGAAALRVLSSDQTLGFTTLGLRAEAQLGAMPLFARAMLGWRHGFGELTPQARTAFVAGTTPAQVFAARIDREALVAEAGLDWRISSATALGLTYSAAIGERSRDHALKGRVEMRF
ncbi:Outer membrane autotransporter barrel domain-containing protein [Bosea sp. 62]|uniref:autotransporter domain-containing protein n=1 Tax=unclassified Bosea (in: a-proteobacteria) TaxID=2653178 RepID=UPI001252FAFA|nr:MULTISPECIES: autotransporter domain-containing protein [unclassified Bosea (in: a-proteobacteria)]CAD5251754.1 Outer membrane autotransporter barrel domain-containing protein [Bosea sp. 21B]CAD5261514.1 Outer membrane autotransporter barrel domain-containing protein [Bosea sp. 7B]CAD5273181.1 Outer membrane autotransporter barrel domain-containing protein [Bosea sp. 46]VVT43456.1 Outer membrane autotransporter barrel domain-containing protein [Bosea sp. EC-HK365B]VXB26320.1 Outer membrane 